MIWEIFRQIFFLFGGIRWPLLYKYFASKIFYEIKPNISGSSAILRDMDSKWYDIFTLDILLWKGVLMNRRKNAKVVIIENIKIAISSTQIQIFFQVRKHLI